jgi:ubiquinone/menaquinone biosynthesis C-methylase UbiE
MNSMEKQASVTRKAAESDFEPVLNSSKGVDLWRELRHRCRLAGDRCYRFLWPKRFAQRKYALELDFWRRQLSDLTQWYENRGAPWWGLPMPREEEKVKSSPVAAANAILTCHQLRPHYLELLQLKGDHFQGQRVLEVGCGPLVPILQFTNCRRYGLDPLASSYKEVGWPLDDLDVETVSVRAEEMPFTDGFFDAVISVNALDHVDDFQQAAREIQRVLKAGGGLYLELEYHEPTYLEPISLDDAVVRQAFSGCQLRKVSERGKREVFENLNIHAEQMPTNKDRLALWHGLKAQT